MIPASTIQTVPNRPNGTNNIKTILLGGCIGNVIEWYDFALFGYFSPLISTVFFPNDNEIVSLLQTYGVFAAGFLMRPLGAGVLGYIGDRMDRRTELFISIILMAVPTFLLGLLPDYEQIGIAAPILLIVIRLAQGLSVGGEFTGSVTYVAETAPSGYRGFATSFTNVGSTLGLLLGLGMVTAITNGLPAASVQTWGWRVPFIFGGLLGLVGLYLRKTLPASELLAAHQTHTDRSFIDALQANVSPMMQTIIYTGGASITYYLLLVYLPTYLAQFTDIAHQQALLINTVAVSVLLPVIPLSGWLTDRLLRRRTLLLIVMLSLLVSCYPAFVLLHHHSILWVWLVQLWFALLLGVLLGTHPAMLVELFPTEVRLTGYSLAFNLGASLAGGTSLLMVTWLIDVTGNVYAPALYLLGASVLSSLALWWMRDRSREPLI